MLARMIEEIDVATGLGQTYQNPQDEDTSGKIQFGMVNLEKI